MSIIWNIYYYYCQLLVPVLTLISSGFQVYHGYQMPYKKKRFSSKVHRWTGLIMLLFPLFTMTANFMNLKLGLVEVITETVVIIVCVLTSLPLLSHLPKSTGRMHRFFAITIAVNIATMTLNTMVYFVHIKLQMHKSTIVISVSVIVIALLYNFSAVLLDLLDMILVSTFGFENAPHKIFAKKISGKDSFIANTFLANTFFNIFTKAKTSDDKHQNKLTTSKDKKQLYLGVFAILFAISIVSIPNIYYGIIGGNVCSDDVTLRFGLSPPPYFNQLPFLTTLHLKGRITTEQVKRFAIIAVILGFSCLFQHKAMIYYLFGDEAYDKTSWFLGFVMYC